MKKKASNALIILLLIVGIGVLCFPFVADRVTGWLNARALEKNGEALRAMETLARKRLLDDAHDYNATLHGGVRDAFAANQPQEDEAYMGLLNASGDGIMGSLVIPKIHVNLPIYHTTNSDVLRLGVGHVYGTSLPVGGEGTHCALAGHSGLPSATILSELDELAEGDLFMIHVAGEVLYYAVDQIVVVEPSETQYLLPESGRDLVTMVTCTPYGINSHRLLVRGSRTADPEEGLTEDASLPELSYAIPMALSLVVLMVIRLIRRARAKARRKREADASGEDAEDSGMQPEETGAPVSERRNPDAPPEGDPSSGKNPADSAAAPEGEESPTDADDTTDTPLENIQKEENTDENREENAKTDSRKKEEDTGEGR